jgi:flagellar hook protein FlgE
MGFSQALSGLNASSKNLDVIGNNIANSATTGFKSSNAQFADVYANSKFGLGTSVSGVMQNFNNGNLESTGRNLDLAISGDGFFQFSQNGQTVYSRNAADGRQRRHQDSRCRHAVQCHHQG